MERGKRSAWLPRGCASEVCRGLRSWPGELFLINALTLRLRSRDWCRLGRCWASVQLLVLGMRRRHASDGTRSAGANLRWRRLAYSAFLRVGREMGQSDQVASSAPLRRAGMRPRGICGDPSGHPTLVSAGRLRMLCASAIYSESVPYQWQVPFFVMGCSLEPISAG